MKKVVLFYIAFLLLSCLVVKADSIAQKSSYTKSVGDGKYTFVMIGEDKKQLLDSQGNQYTSSGLYDNSTGKAVWLADWYSHGIYLSSDGVYAVDVHPYTLISEAMKAGALEFYKNGKLTKKYNVSDMIYNKKHMYQSVSLYRWGKDHVFNEGNNTIIITTVEDNSYTFDITDGKLINGKVPGILNKIYRDWKLALFAVIVVLYVFIMKIYKRKKFV